MRPSFRKPSKGYPEIWGGVECSFVRVGDTFRDQCRETGHSARPADLEGIAALRLRTLRYPFLLEQISHNRPEETDWSWHDKQVCTLKQHGITLIAGLVHHGSGPKYTNLLDPGFPKLLALHAKRVAERYPWIKAFTPINEPLTTARFSGLYGYWFPHGRDERTFLRVLANECLATCLAMEAIRTLSPDATLVQTEDLGKTFSTPHMRYQADYNNERRWLSLDLLCGRVSPQHSWHARFLTSGVSSELLKYFEDHPCPPDIVGINYYLTSDRYLDQDRHLFPASSWGANSRERFADVAATRVDLREWGYCSAEATPSDRLLETWDRYRLPVAITEVHNGCSREEQLRWLDFVWREAISARDEGADVRAVTVWSMFGSLDWNSLLLQQNHLYESGIFDGRCNPARPTALALATKDLIERQAFDHPVLNQPGWWERHDRFYRPVDGKCSTPVCVANGRMKRPIVIIGNGLLGVALERASRERNLDPIRIDENEVRDSTLLFAAQKRRAWAIIDACDTNWLNADVQGAQKMSRIVECLRKSGVALMRIEIGKTGRWQHISERSDAQPLVIRTSGIFGATPWDDLVFNALRVLADGEEYDAPTGKRSVTYLPDLVSCALDLLIDGESGYWPLVTEERVSDYALLSFAAELAGISPQHLNKIMSTSLDHDILLNSRGSLLPGICDALSRHVRDFKTASGNTAAWETAAMGGKRGRLRTPLAINALRTG